MNYKDMENSVYELLKEDHSGHDISHVLRVVALTRKLCEKEHGDVETACKIALLHDCDDYKLFGLEQSKQLTNAHRILNECHEDEKTISVVLSEISKIGYSKRLKGVQPETLEGKIVSDADMLDAIGAHGIVRTIQFGNTHHQVFFAQDEYPKDQSYNSYTSHYNDSTMPHFFEKLLRLKDMMLTDSGKEEAIIRHRIMYQFLENFFIEENNEEWLNILKAYE